MSPFFRSRRRGDGEGSLKAEGDVRERERESLLSLIYSVLLDNDFDLLLYVLVESHEVNVR